MNIVSGTSNPALCYKICKDLNTIPLNVSIKHFLDREVFIEIHENIDNKNIFLIQSTCSPVNDTLMEMLMMADTLKRNFAKNITAVIPYFGYARQDRKIDNRSSIGAKLVSNLLVCSGISSIITIDLHSPQIQSFFDIPIQNISSFPLFTQHILEKSLPFPIIVSPDIGGVARARALAKSLSLDLAIVDKRRLENGCSQALQVIGDVQGKNCILIDDIIDSGGTINNASDILLAHGAKDVRAYVTHGVLSKNVFSKSSLTSLTITDSIPHPPSSSLEIISLAKILGDVIKESQKYV